MTPRVDAVALREAIKTALVRAWNAGHDKQPFAVAHEADEILAPPVVAGETWETMFAWTEETFGPVSLERVAARANEEMQELLEDPSDVMEAADVCIVLSRYPGIAEAINRKMAINRARKWRLNGDGSGYHIKPEATATAEVRSVGTPEGVKPNPIPTGEGTP